MTADRHVTNESLPFAMIPEALLYDRTLSDKAVRLYGALRRHGDDPSNCYPSKRRLGDLLGCAPASINRPTRELEDAGWVRRVPREGPTGEQTSHGYFVFAAPRISSAGGAQESEGGGALENAGPPRTGARQKRASELQPVSNEIDADSVAVVEGLCSMLADFIEQNGSKRPEISKRWRDACRLMIERDGRDAEKIGVMIRWCQNDEFWRVNILSMSALRAKFDQLRLARNRDIEKRKAQQEAAAPKGLSAIEQARLQRASGQ